MRDPFDFAAIDEGAGPALRPKPAAALVLVKREGRRFRLLMGRRGDAHIFLPGRFVFPGGRVERADYRVQAADDLRPEITARLAKHAKGVSPRALALAAIRETYEETGFLLGARNEDLRGEEPRSSRAPAWRSFFAQGMVPALGALDFVARAITPPGRSRRFDARFFMADAERIAHVPPPPEADRELVDLAWLTPAEARGAEILPITHCVLDEIEARLTAGPDPSRSTPFFIPRRGKAVLVRL